MRTLSYLGSALLLFIGSSCQEKKEGKSIGAPQVEPPVTQNLPEGLTGGTSLLLSESLSQSSMIDAIKSYLYPDGGGPSPSNRLKKIDERMSSLNQRAEDSARKCLENGAVAWSLPASLPTGEAFESFFQCQETLSNTSSLAFGTQGENFYLTEQTGSSEEEAIIVYARANSDGSSIDTWEIAYQANASDHGSGSSGARLTYTHIIGADGSGVEVTTVGTGTSYPLACGIHLKSDDNFVYVVGSYAQGDECVDVATYCYDAKTLAEADVSSCTGAGLDVFELTTITRDMATEGLEAALPHMNTKVSGYVEFNEDAE